MDLDDIMRGLRAEIKKMENEKYLSFQCKARQMCKDVLAKLEEQESEIAELKVKLEDVHAAAVDSEGGRMKEFYFGRKRWYDADEVDKLLADLRENHKKATERDTMNWNRLYVKYNKLIELKKDFCEKFDDILNEMDK